VTGKVRRNIRFGVLIYVAVVVAALCYAFFGNFAQSENVRLGNVLSTYFYYTGSGHNHKNVEVIRKLSATYADAEIKELLDKLDWEKPPRDLKYSSPPAASFNPIQLRKNKPRKTAAKKNYAAFWSEMRPEVRAFYEENIPIKDVEKPVIHFRCSDSPFNKHPYYHLTPRASVEWMAEAIIERGYKSAILLNCNKHYSNNDDPCRKYAEFYTSIFENKGIDIEQHCGSVLEDFALMVYSPLLVGMGTSSFSFMAGISKKPNSSLSISS